MGATQKAMLVTTRGVNHQSQQESSTVRSQRKVQLFRRPHIDCLRIDLIRLHMHGIATRSRDSMCLLDQDPAPLRICLVGRFARDMLNSRLTTVHGCDTKGHACDDRWHELSDLTRIVNGIFSKKLLFSTIRD